MVHEPDPHHGHRGADHHDHPHGGVRDASDGPNVGFAASLRSRDEVKKEARLLLAQFLFQISFHALILQASLVTHVLLWLVVVLSTQG